MRICERSYIGPAWPINGSELGPKRPTIRKKELYLGDSISPEAYSDTSPSISWRLTWQLSVSQTYIWMSVLSRRGGKLCACGWCVWIELTEKQKTGTTEEDKRGFGRSPRHRESLSFLIQGRLFLSRWDEITDVDSDSSKFF